LDNKVFDNIDARHNHPVQINKLYFFKTISVLTVQNSANSNFIIISNKARSFCHHCLSR